MVMDAVVDGVWTEASSCSVSEAVLDRPGDGSSMLA